MSPTANTSGCPGSEQSGSTLIRPARSHSAPDASASIRASGDAATPAAQIFVLAAIALHGAVAALYVDAVARRRR